MQHFTNWWKLRTREGKSLAQGHTACWQQSWNHFWTRSFDSKYLFHCSMLLTLQKKKKNDPRVTHLFTGMLICVMLKIKGGGGKTLVRHARLNKVSCFSKVLLQPFNPSIECDCFREEKCNISQTYLWSYMAKRSKHSWMLKLEWLLTSNYFLQKYPDFSFIDLGKTTNGADSPSIYHVDQKWDLQNQWSLLEATLTPNYHSPPTSDSYSPSTTKSNHLCVNPSPDCTYQCDSAAVLIWRKHIRLDLYNFQLRRPVGWAIW